MVCIDTVVVVVVVVVAARAAVLLVAAWRLSVALRECPTHSTTPPVRPPAPLANDPLRSAERTVEPESRPKRIRKHTALQRVRTRYTCGDNGEYVRVAHAVNRARPRVRANRRLMPQDLEENGNERKSLTA